VNGDDQHDSPFRYTILIGRPPAAIWQALTQKEVIDRYFLAPLAVLDLRPGGRISYGSPQSECIVGAIIEIEEPHKLVHTFCFAGSAESESVVTYEIVTIGEAVSSLDITHSGLPRESQVYADVAAGWPAVASSMKTLLETGLPLLRAEG